MDYCQKRELRMHYIHRVLTSRIIIWCAYIASILKHQSVRRVHPFSGPWSYSVKSASMNVRVLPLNAFQIENGIEWVKFICVMQPSSLVTVFRCSFSNYTQLGACSSLYRRQKYCFLSSVLISVINLITASLLRFTYSYHQTLSSWFCF